eukprot:SAG11_NODE_2025_length_3908_cov_1.787346_3_plen_125_part_00
MNCCPPGTASSAARTVPRAATAGAGSGSGAHRPITAPEMIGPEYSSCTPGAGRLERAAAAAKPTRWPSRSQTAGSAWRLSTGMVSPHAPSRKTHVPPSCSSSSSLVAPGQSGEISEFRCPKEVG